MHSHLERWLEFPAEYGFEYCYRPKEKNYATDFLSRYEKSLLEDFYEVEIFVTELSQEDLFGGLLNRH